MNSALTVFPFPASRPALARLQVYLPGCGGGGVFRFQDGSLLKVAITGGAYCIDLADLTAPVGHLTVTYQITGGTGRFKGASGALTLNSTLTPVVFAADNSVKLVTNTGTFEGTVFGAALDDERDDERQ